MQIAKSKIIVSIGFLACLHCSAWSQNVGINTSSPQRKLTVRGSIMLDQGNHNFGTLDSAALVFGSAGTVGITAKKTGGGTGISGMSFWTGGQENLTLSSSGNLGINGPYSASYVLQVNGGNSFFDGNITGDNNITANNSIIADNNISAGGSISADNNITADNAVRALTRVGIGGNENNSYRLYVHNGHSYFQGNISASGNHTVNGTVTVGNNVAVGNNLSVGGTINTENNMVIKGTGSVRSEGPSPLRVGFTTYTVNPYINLDAHEWTTVIINLPDFDDASDIRILFSDYIPANAALYQSFNRFHFRVEHINATNNTFSLRIHNYSDALASIEGTLHFVTIMKDN